jgi:group I intron endonuclease
MELYLVHCLVTDKYYVGKTVQTLASRWYHHVWDAEHSNRKTNSPLHNAIRKYGSKEFRISYLATASTPEELSQLERMWILVLGSYNRTVGYNASFGGDGGGIPTAETRAKLRNRKSPWIGKKHSEATKTRMRKKHASFSIETREKFSQIRKGIPWSESRRKASVGKEFGRNTSAT